MQSGRFVEREWSSSVDKPIPIFVSGRDGWAMVDRCRVRLESGGAMLRYDAIVQVFSPLDVGGCHHVSGRCSFWANEV